MDILDRVKMIMKMNQLNAAGFADRIGVQRSNVSHVLTGRNKPSLDFIEKVLLQFPKVNASWLISGHIQQADAIVPVTEVQENLNRSSQGDVTNVTIQSDEASVPETTSKRIVKIITFYEDFTFDEYTPNALRD